MFDIVTVGSATKDVFLFTKQASLKFGINSHFLELPLDRKLNVDTKMEFTGGSATNTAAPFSNFGKNVAVISKIGNDSNGDFILSDLKARKINTDFLIRAEGETPFSTIIVSKMNKAIILVYRGVENTLTFDELRDDFSAKWMLIGPLAGDSFSLLKSLLSFCEERDIKVALNLGASELSLGIKKLGSIMKNVEVISMNSLEAREFVGLSNDIRNILELKKKAKIAIITKGAEGSIVADSDRIYYAQALKANQINYIGAGDAYLSGFVTALMDGKDIKEAINLAAHNSAAVVQKYGAKSGLLSKYPDTMIKIKEVEYKKQ